MKVSIAIGVDSVPAFGKYEGRIVAVKPAGWQWGTEEVKHFLVLEIDLGNIITTIEDAQKLTVPHFETKELWWPSSDENTPRMIAKHRYLVPFVDVASKAQLVGISFDLAKVKDKEVAYQPLEKKTIPFEGMIYDVAVGTKTTNLTLTAMRDGLIK